MNTFVTPITIADLDSIVGIQQLCYSNEFLESRQSFADKLTMSTHCLGVTDGKNLVAYAIALPWAHLSELKLNTTDASIVDSPNCLYVHDIAVLPSYRGQGLAELLMRYLLKRACLAGFSWMDLVAVQGSKSRWAKMGFVETELVVSSYGGQSAAMTLPLRQSIGGFTYRAAIMDDYPEIVSLVSKVEAIRVSSSIQFYEPTEFLSFVGDVDWAVGVAVDSKNQIVAFSTAHRMSWHWTLLDNFLVNRHKRKLGVGKALYGWNQLILGLWRTRYITTLVDPADIVSREFLEMRGWHSEKQYLWMDLHKP